MRIGELAKASGIAPTALRFYERRGLLRARRSANGYRTYNEADVARVRFVRAAQALGFGLEEIERVLTMSDRAGTASAASLAPLARAKLAEIEDKISALARLKDGIETLLKRGRPDGAPCPVLASLAPCTTVKRTRSTA